MTLKKETKVKLKLTFIKDFSGDKRAKFIIIGNTFDGYDRLYKLKALNKTGTNMINFHGAYYRRCDLTVI